MPSRVRGLDRTRTNTRKRPQSSLSPDSLLLPDYSNPRSVSLPTARGRMDHASTHPALDEARASGCRGQDDCVPALASPRHAHALATYGAPITMLRWGAIACGWGGDRAVSRNIIRLPDRPARDRSHRRAHGHKHRPTEPVPAPLTQVIHQRLANITRDGHLILQSYMTALRIGW